MFWAAPLDESALGIFDQFLLGDDVLVAPVMKPGARSRDVYLPRGTWRDTSHRGGQSHAYFSPADTTVTTYQGPLWLQNLSAPLDTLLMFTRTV